MDFLTAADWQRAACQRLPRFVYDYVTQGADAGLAMARNRAALDEIVLWPSVLTDTSSVDSSVQVLGRRWNLPFGIAPMGLNGLITPGADGILARVAQARDLVFCLSTAANASMEEVRAAAPKVQLWLQLYVLTDRRFAESMLARARASGVQALVLTVDVPVSGQRLADRRSGFSLPLKIRPRLVLDVLSHPRWSLGQLKGPGFGLRNFAPEGANDASAQAALLSRGMDRSLNWSALAWLRSHWDGPLILKGILSPADAKMAQQHGADAIIVSNHGGRQLDAAPASVCALEKIASSVRGDLPVFLDSGIRSGLDVARALSVGACGVFLGRPLLYGLAASGQSGAEAVIEMIEKDLIRTQCLCGRAKASDWRAAWSAKLDAPSPT